MTAQTSPKVVVEMARKNFERPAPTQGVPVPKDAHVSISRDEALAAQFGMSVDRWHTILIRFRLLLYSLQIADACLADIAPDMSREYKMRVNTLKAAIAPLEALIRKLGPELQEALYDENGARMQIFASIIGMDGPQLDEVLKHVMDVRHDPKHLDRRAGGGSPKEAPQQQKEG